MNDSPDFTYKTYHYFVDFRNVTDMEYHSFDCIPVVVNKNRLEHNGINWTLVVLRDNVIALDGRPLYRCAVSILCAFVFKYHLDHGYGGLGVAKPPYP